jgi:hypothetical protein
MRIPTLKHFYFYQLVYPLALFFVKASILALYHRIFERAKFRYKIYSVAAFVTVYTIVVLFVNVCILQPFSEVSNKSRLLSVSQNLHKLGHLPSQKGATIFELPTSHWLLSILSPI